MAFFDAITIDIYRDDLLSPWEFKGKPDGNSGVSFGLTQALGLEFPEMEIFTQPKGLGDGVFFTGQRMQPRTIEIHAKQLGRTPEELFHHRRQIMEYFLMDHEFKIVIEVEDQGTWSTKTRCLNDCKLIAASYPTIDAADTNPEIVLQFLAPDPYFEAPTESTRTVANLGESVEWTTVGVTGDVKVRPIIKMTCTTTKPNVDYVAITMPELGLYSITVFNYARTGAYVQVGDVILIDPEAGEILVNGTNTGHPGDINSIFMKLYLYPNSNNNFAYWTSDTSQTTNPGTKWTVEFEWTERFAGI